MSRGAELPVAWRAGLRCVCRTLLLPREREFTGKERFGRLPRRLMAGEGLGELIHDLGSARFGGNLDDHLAVARGRAEYLRVVGDDGKRLNPQSLGEFGRRDFRA